MEGYKFQPALLAFEYGDADLSAIAAAAEKHGGWNPLTKTLKPFALPIQDHGREGVHLETWEVLDSITAATEAGALQPDNWLETAFNSKNVRESFIQALTAYDYRLNDRWHGALCYLVQAGPDAFLCPDGARLVECLEESLAD